MLRDALASYLSRTRVVHVVAVAADGRETLDQIGRAAPDVAVVEAFMPPPNGFEVATDILRGARTRTPVVLLSDEYRNSLALRAIRAGISGYVTKQQPSRELLETIQAVSCGRVHIACSKSLPTRSDPELVDDILTPREQQVLQLIAIGRSTKEVASILGVAAKTAQHHRERLMQKLDIHSIAELTRLAIRQGLVPP